MRRSVIMILAVASIAFAGCNDFKLDNGTVDPDDNPGGEVTGTVYVENGVNFGEGTEIDGVIWAPVNAGSTKDSKKGKYFSFDEAKTCCPKGWRLPSETEMQALIMNRDPDVRQYDGWSGRWHSGLEEFVYTESDVEVPSSPASAIVFLPFAGYVAPETTVEETGRYWAEGKSGVGMMYDCDFPHHLYKDNGLYKFSARCVRNDSELVLPTMKMYGTSFTISYGGGSAGNSLYFEYPDGRGAHKGLEPAINIGSNNYWGSMDLEFDSSGDVHRYYVLLRAPANTTSETKEAEVNITFFDQTITCTAKQYPKL